MTALGGIATGYDDLVAFTGPDLVVAPGTAVGLHRFVRLHVADVDDVRLAPVPGFGRTGVGSPGVVGHPGSGSAGEEAPRDEQRDHDECARDEEDVAPSLHLLPEGVQAHGDTVPR